MPYYPMPFELRAAVLPWASRPVTMRGEQIELLSRMLGCMAALELAGAEVALSGAFDFTAAAWMVALDDEDVTPDGEAGEVLDALGLDVGVFIEWAIENGLPASAPDPGPASR